MDEKRQADAWTPSNETKPDLDDSRRPLIDRVINNWRSEKAAYSYQADELEIGCCDLENENSCPNALRRGAISGTLRRMFLSVLLSLIFVGYIWHSFIRPRLQEEWEMKEGFLVQENGTYGIAKGGDFDGLRMATLDDSLIPGGAADPKGKRRLVFVGDIHGCAHELKKLLKRIEFDEEMDHLVAVGDTISKGPENVEVLDELVRLEATSVRGNHEDRILAIAPSILDNDVSETSSKGAAKDAKLLRKLKKRHIKFLETMPLMLRIPALPMADEPSHKDKSPIAEDILVVHAGLVPAIPLEKQDPFFVMNMRSITTKKHLPQIEAASKKSKSKPWHDVWGWYNDRLFRKKSIKDFGIWDTLEWNTNVDSWFGSSGLASSKKWPKPQVVVYGHHAKAGLQVERWSKGLDTGCVRGGKLTAMVLDARGRQEIVSVGCKDRRE